MPIRTYQARLIAASDASEGGLNLTGGNEGNRGPNVEGIWIGVFKTLQLCDCGARVYGSLLLTLLLDQWSSVKRTSLVGSDGNSRPTLRTAVDW